jgi:outer membrane protein OmpA-like peptidoglycan-associated protein
MKTLKLITLATAAALSLSIAMQSFAQQVRYYPLDKAPTPIEVAKALVGPQFKPNLKMRGIRPIGSMPVPAEMVGAEPALTPSAAPEFKADTSGALAMPIPFAFDSASLMPNAKMPLDQIAEGIKLVQNTAPVVVMIEGHTDSVGNPQYNKRLSQRRAAAVKSYLISQHGIDPKLLKSVGRGEVEPLNPENPRGQENRRVQFRVS